MTEKRVTLIPYSVGGHSLAGEQTLRDIVRFSSELGFVPVYLYLPSARKGIIKWVRRIYNARNFQLKILRELSGDTLLIPYPSVFRLGGTFLSLTCRNVIKSFIQGISKRFSQVILYVYDLPIEQNAYSRPESRTTLITSADYFIEESLFDLATKILVFNEAMEKTIRERYCLPKKRFIHFEILDLGVKLEPHPRINDIPFRTVFYVGNLSKSHIGGIEKHLNKLPPNVRVSFIGPNGEWLEKFGTHYVGILPADELYHVLSIKGDFGLVWYSLNSSRYFMFGSSSKFSTYLVSGLPVLVDKHATWPAKLAEKYNVGITAKTLTELLFRASEIDSQEYSKLRRNALTLGEKIRKGYFMKRALKEAMGVEE